MTNPGDIPLIKRALNQSRSLTGGLRETADRHNSAMKTLLEHALKAQAELYKGQLAVIEHFIGTLNPQPPSPPASRVQPTTMRTPDIGAPTAAPTVTPAASASATLASRAQAIAAAAAAASRTTATTPLEPVRPTTSAAAEPRTAIPPRPTPFASK